MTSRLQPLIPTKQQYALFSGDTPRHILEASVDRRVSAWIQFSRVGFNRSRDKAILYVEHEGSGGYCVLVKRKGRWKAKDYVLSWIR